MKLKKTPKNQRNSYAYYFDNGDAIILERGKQIINYKSGERNVIIDPLITSKVIQNLHKEDDLEVRANLKYINIETNKQRKLRIANKKEWKKNNREDAVKNPYNHPERIISLDSGLNDKTFFEDKRKTLYEASLTKELLEDQYLLEKKLMRDYIATLPNKMQELYNLIYIQGLSQIEVSKLLKLSKSTISERLKNLNKKIKEKFKKPNF